MVCQGGIILGMEPKRGQKFWKERTECGPDGCRSNLVWRLAFSKNDLEEVGSWKVQLGGLFLLIGARDIQDELDLRPKFGQEDPSDALEKYPG